MATTITVELNREHFLDAYNDILSLLKELESAGLGGAPTSDLCDKVFNSRRKGMDIIREAESYGYVHRFKVPKGKVNKRKAHKPGPSYHMNTLTPTGRQLLSKLQMP